MAVLAVLTNSSMLITLYGINNIGKTTQALKLTERLKEMGHDAVYVKYPVYEVEPSGIFLNKFLRSGSAQTISEEELQMWFTLNRYQFEPTLKNWLDEGKIVIAEDYTGTGIAWGTTKGASTKWLEGINRHLIRENLAILLDGERFTHAQEADHLHEGNPEYMKRSRQVHLELGEKYGWTLVPVQGSADETASILWELIRPQIEN